MPRAVLPVALFLVSHSLALAQFDTVDVAWERPLTSPTFGGLHPIEVEATPDGGVLIVGLARALPLNDFDLDADVVLMKLDENGGMEWTDTIASPPVSNSSLVASRRADAVVDRQGNVFVVVSRSNASALRRYDSGGTLAWEETLPTRSFPGTTLWNDYGAGWVDLQPTGDVIVCGVVEQATYPRADVRAFAPDGTPRWEWRGNGAAEFSSTAMLFPTGIEIGQDGRIHIRGPIDNLSSFRAGTVITLDSDGQFLWKTQLSTNARMTAFALDAQGGMVSATPTFLFGSIGFRLERLSMNGDVVAMEDYLEPGFRLEATCITTDALDRIFVGGSRRPDALGARDAALFRFDPTGTFLGSETPSVQGAAQDGSFEELHLTTHGDIVALGSSRTGGDEIILARFAPDGTERWARRRRGHPPMESESPSVGLGLAVDSRGNLFTLAETVEGGAFPFLTLGLDLAKHVQNGPVSNSYCGPAAANSTGLPASLRALGPRLVTADNLTLRADDLPPGALTLLLASRTQGNVPNVGGGQGTFCLGGSIGRFFGPGQVRVADPTGSAGLQLDLPQLPQPNGSVPGMAGESWNFQAWYRDANPGPTSNLTDGVEVTFQ
ncbi:MAG: hypothetical protein AAGG01_11740 [Planctomycetota bacterium]